MDTAALQASFAKVAKHGDAVPLHFYGHLFVNHRELRPMFPASMAAQRDKLVNALLQVVSNVHQVESVVPFLQQLGRDHRKFGVLPEHYPMVGASLLATLEWFLGEDWTPPLAADWTAAYGIVADVMIEAAEAADQEPPWYDAEVLSVEQRCPGVGVLTVRPDHPVPYRAGQSISLQHPAAARSWRFYSPANAPRRDDTIELHVRAVDAGFVSPALVYGTSKGDVVRLGSPVGVGLELDAGSPGELLMLAGGTGLAPMRALIEDLMARGEYRRTALYVGARDPSELYDMKALLGLQEHLPWLTIAPVVTTGSALGVYSGTPASVAVAHRRWDRADVYVCGSDRMVKDSLDALRASGVSDAQLRYERYTYDRHTNPDGMADA